MKLSGLAGVLWCAALATGTARAESALTERATIGVSLDVSVLLGVGVSIGVPVGDQFNLRIAHHLYSQDREFEDDNGATYDGELDLKNTGLMGDWHPFRGAFRVTAGFLANGNQINLMATDNGTGEYDVGNCTYQSSPMDPLSVDGVTDFKSTAPYFGIGWGGNLNAAPGFFGTFDFGVMFSGSPDTRLKGRGSAGAKAGQGPECGSTAPSDVSNNAEFKQQVQNAEDDVNESTKDFKLWPNIAFGIGWRF